MGFAPKCAEALGVRGWFRISSEPLGKTQFPLVNIAYAIEMAAHIIEETQISEGNALMPRDWE